ncbi:hypothetical protein PhCBS80983_g02889 [Powellomyces hirtus]|uniref:Uncharacterized protein n=1 Tax=Powellomyces hirtus TaxID=109895 RepID=A0A507E6R0_9FUNG|nr:hypothetical protein PhCBS80983_g02889 [Powellomyces hirtus]
MTDKELELLENVELRFALADTNDRFEKAVTTFLTPVLIKLDSPHKPVQTKVMGICSHVSKRLKSNPDIKVPMSALLDLFANPKSSTLLRNFCLIYLDLGFARSSKEERVKLLPGLFRDLAARLPAQQGTIFQMALQVFATSGDFKSDGGDPFDWQSHPEDLKFLLTKFLDVILYTFAPAGRPMTALSMGRQSEATTPSAPFVPPGLSKNALTFLVGTHKAPWTTNPNDLRALKLGIIRFISLAESIPEHQNVLEKFVIYLAASGDSNYEIVSAGEDGIKRHAKPDLESEDVIKALYSLYQGTGAQRNEDVFRSPATPSLKNRILRVLLKSAMATNMFPQMIQVAFDALNGEHTTAKLRAAGMSFVQWIARMSKEDKIKPVAPVLLSALLHFINTPLDTPTPDAETLRGFAYEAVGLLCKRVPDLFDTPLLYQFFSSISSENANVRVSVLDALSNMVNAYKSVAENEEKRKEMEKILLDNIEKPNHHSRFIAQKYTNTIFAPSYPLARYINIMLAADLKPEVREESRRGLEFPVAISAKTPTPLPVFADMTHLLVTKQRENNTARVAPGVRRVGAFSADAYTDAIRYLRHLLILSADPDAAMGRKGLDELEKISETTTRAKVREYLQNVDGATEYREFLETALKSDAADAVLQSVAAFCLLELVSLGPKDLARVYSEKIDWVVSFVSSVRGETRKSMAHILGIVATAHLEEPARAQRLVELVTTLQSTVQDKQLQVENRHGATLAIGFIVGRLRYRYSQEQAFVPAELLATSLNAIVAELDAMSALEVLGACDAIAEAGRYSALPLPSDDARKAVVDKLVSMAKNAKDSKVQEEAITALGQLAHGDSATSTETILDFLYSLATAHSKHVEVHFTIGEAITAAACGFKATHMEEHLDIADVTPAVNVSDQIPIQVLTTLLEKVRPGASPPAVRKSVAVWLLCIVKLAGANHPVVRTNVMQLQNAFANLLNDQDEFTQEAASRGMGLVFELGDSGVRDQLVTSLVSTLTEGKRIAPQSVTPETQLFRENALGSTPGSDGAHLTGTYQSILSLASEMNQPDLVYRFMSLAAHNAIWNSRRGASLGFSTIATQASAQLQPHLPLIVPKLYRFQFDPHPKTAESMKNIWQTLVPEPAKTLDQYFTAIVKDLLAGMADRQWRIREASCLALADLTHGKQMEQLREYLEQMWVMTFRALDDIKESVRVAAFKTAKTLTTKTTRYTDPSVNTDIKEAAKIVAIVVPFFLTKGLGSQAEDVRTFSLATILKISKKAGVLLKPHLTDLVGTLLECLSTMEPQVLNYLTFHTDKYNISQEQLENTRLSAVKQSPIMDALETCIDQAVDAETLNLLVPRLTNLIRKGVGLPTKAGAARIVYSLVQRAPNELAGQHADAIVKALTASIFDRSVVVRKANATAIGQIAKLASDTSIMKLIDLLQNSYLGDPTSTTHDEDARSVAGITTLEFAKRAPERVTAFHARLIPLAFIGARDDDSPNIKQTWKDAWEELTGGSNAPLRMYMDETVALITHLMNTSPSWTIKKQVARAVADVSAVLPQPQLETLLPALIPLLVTALAGRTWDGKEVVVQSLAELVSNAPRTYWANATPLRDAVVKTVLTESRKNNKQYKRHAIDALGKTLHALNDHVTLYTDIYDDLAAIAASDPMDKDTLNSDDDEDDVRLKPLQLVLRAAAFKALGLAFPTRRFANEEKQHAATTLQLLARQCEGNVWNVTLAVLEALELVVKDLTTTTTTTNGAPEGSNVTKDDPMDIDGGFTPQPPYFEPDTVDPQTIVLVAYALCAALEDMKYTKIRETAARILLRLVQAATTVAPTSTAATTTAPLIPQAEQQPLATKLEALASKEPIPGIADVIRDARKVVMKA